MAAGKGTRMKSRLPKVLQRLAGKPLLGHVLDTASLLQARSAVVITGHGADEVEAAVVKRNTGLPVKFVRQEPQLGTGHSSFPYTHLQLPTKRAVWIQDVCCIAKK